jgi:hypothetical protein
MGMYCGLYKLSPPDVDRLLKDPKLISDLINSEPTDGSYLSLEKAWHGLHYLLTGYAHAGPLPLSFIFAGGQNIGADLEYGPARLLSTQFVKDLESSLRELTINDLWQRFDPVKMSQEKIYPEIWDEPEGELKDEYGWYFDDLKNFVRSASSAENAIVIVIV